MTSIAKSFALPHDPLTPLDPQTQPNPATIRLLRQELYTNAQSVSSLLGGGSHGHLGLLMDDAAYTAISHGNVPYIFPALPDVPDYNGTTQVEREAMKDAYTVAMANYLEARNLLSDLKALIIKAVPDLYISTLKHPDFSYANVSPKELLAYLVAEYAQITADDMKQNRERLATAWDPDTPIETVFTNGTTCRLFATAGQDPISDKQYIAILLNTFDKSGVFEKATTDWEEKEEADHTVATFIDHFKKADKFRRKRLNSMKGVLTANTAITNQTKPMLEWGTYCWSHGICSHTSANCTYPATGHNKKATLTNILGGKLSMSRPPGYTAIFVPKPFTNTRKDKTKKAKDPATPAVAAPAE
jgi:hypothetical protein